ncbi:MAG: carbamoyltransferase [Elusimicrobia bacterium]|nr:carbamoyltransferase [Elusimicrobiota bacterium]
MKTILGINAVFHDSSAALLVEGRLRAVAEEERCSRVRHAKRASVDNTPILPYLAIDEALRAAGLDFSRVDEVAYSFDPAARFAALGRLPEDPGIPAGDYGSPEGERRFHDLILLTAGLLKARYGRQVPVRFIPHHDCHMAASYYSCPWDEAALLTVDGIGEDDTVTWGRCGRGGLERLGRLEYPHSLGFLWERVTQWAGLTPNLDEGTTMALAAYGDPERFRAALRRVLRPLADGTFRVEAALARFRAPDVRGFEELLGPRRLPQEPLLWQGEDRRHADAAAALQELTEEALCGLARRVRREAGVPRLALAGGVALNCLANTAVARCGAFDEIWAFPAATDCGTAFGAACVGSRLAGTEPVREEWTHAFRGPAEPAASVSQALSEARLQAPARPDSELVAESAGLLASGKVVAWYEGACEVGPRALCHRSLLADPRQASMRGHLNLRVKHRQAFRPYGPVVREQDAAEYFDIPPALRGPCRFMLAAVPVKAGARQRIAAVLHEDGTTRPQIISQQAHPRLHALLGEFGRRTGVPLLINTSFNDREPIVGTPAHALATFLRAEIDALVLEDRLLVKQTSAAPSVLRNRRSPAGTGGSVGGPSS